jgi:uncharacterized protein YecT (DUF1311 family)
MFNPIAAPAGNTRCTLAARELLRCPPFREMLIMPDQGESPSNKNAQILLAVISLIGTLSVTVIANWEKLFPRPAVPFAAPAPTAVAPFAAAPAEVKNTAAPIPEPSREVHSQPQQLMPSVGPSFDCAKAIYRSEQLVCASPELSVLDLAMANAYRDAAARVGTKERKVVLRNVQNHWMRKIREACADAVCLRDTYEQRIRELNAIQR